MTVDTTDLQATIARLERKLARERSAREQAEQVIEQKSLELYHKNLDLQALAEHLREALQKAEAATRLKSEFLALMSHEIRTPLNGVLGMVQLLELEKLNVSQTDLVHNIRQSGEMLYRLLNDILDFSKIEAGRIEIDVHDFDLYECIDSTANLFAPIAEKKGLHLIVEKNRWLPKRIYSDSMRLQQILSNLVSNAIKFTRTGSITIRAHTTHRDCGIAELVFEVVDTGMGIAQEKQERLFQAFSQADSTTSRQFGGTGLGLVISKRLAILLGGDIILHSSEGVGSTFTVTIKANVAKSDGRQGVLDSMSPEHTLQTTAKWGRWLALVVDDNAINRTVTSRFMQYLGIQTELASSGTQALEMIQGRNFDVILMDVQMPDMDGWETTKCIRRLQIDNQPYIIALTASAYESDKITSLEVGMNDYVSKPVVLKDLRSALIRVNAATI